MLLKDFLKFVEDNKGKIDLETCKIQYKEYSVIVDGDIYFRREYKTDEDMVYGFRNLTDALEGYLINKKERLP